jgi:hypothetical protein
MSLKKIKKNQTTEPRRKTTQGMYISSKEIKEESRYVIHHRHGDVIVVSHPLPRLHLPIYHQVLHLPVSAKAAVIEHTWESLGVTVTGPLFTDNSSMHVTYYIAVSTT